MASTTCPKGYAGCTFRNEGDYSHTVTHPDDGYVTLGFHSHTEYVESPAVTQHRAFVEAMTRSVTDIVGKHVTIYAGNSAQYRAHDFKNGGETFVYDVTAIVALGTVCKMEAIVSTKFRKITNIVFKVDGTDIYGIEAAALCSLRVF